tara:strand:+ start:2702 stop:3142 length:441 start_codon:yes stop_codon:yes gene_type:complete
MNFRLWKDIEKTYDGGMSGPNPYGNDLSSLISTIRENRRREELNALNWQNEVDSMRQKNYWDEKNQKLDNRFAGLLGDVGKGNKWHSLAQGVVGLGANKLSSSLANSAGNFDAAKNIWQNDAVMNNRGFTHSLNFPSFSSGKYFTP